MGVTRGGRKRRYASGGAAEEPAAVGRERLAAQEPPHALDGLPHGPGGLRIGQADPREEVGRPRAEPEVEPAAGQLVHRGGQHGELGRVDGVRIQDAGAELDPRGRVGHGGEDHGGAAEEEVVRHPELVEPGRLGGAREGDVVGQREVVIQAETEAHPPRRSPPRPRSRRGTARR